MGKLTATHNPLMAKNMNNSGVRSTGVSVPLTSIRLDPEFQALFELDDKFVQLIAGNMREKGFDHNFPLFIWEEEGILIDGHTRFKAAQEAGLYDVFVKKISFPDRKTAKLYAIRLQVERRSLTDAQKFRAFKEINFLKTGKRDEDDKGKSAEAVAAILGSSTRQVEKMRSIAKDEELSAAVEKDELSINQAYGVQHPKKQKNNLKDLSSCTAEDLQEDDGGRTAESETSGNPAPLGNFTHSDNTYRPSHHPAEETDADRWMQEKNRQVAQARKEGIAEGFEKALVFALAEVKKGRTPEDVYNDPRIADLSPDVISGFTVPEDDEAIAAGFIQ